MNGGCASVNLAPALLCSSGALGSRAARVQAQALASVHRVDDSNVVGDWRLKVGQTILDENLCGQIASLLESGRGGLHRIAERTHPADSDVTRRLTLCARLRGVGFCKARSGGSTKLNGGSICIWLQRRRSAVPAADKESIATNSRRSIRSRGDATPRIIESVGFSLSSAKTRVQDRWTLYEGQSGYNPFLKKMFREIKATNHDTAKS